MKIYYLVPVTQKPSWGMGIIYDHVSMLRDAGFDAFIIKEKDLKVPAWLHLEVPLFDYLHLKKNIKKEDILVVPEAMLDFPGLKEIRCKKILFVQASAFLFESMPKNEDHLSLGFEHVIIIMPHMESIVKNHIKLPYTSILPYVADYFFSDDISLKRKRQILIYPKFHQIDYSIVKYLVSRQIEKINKHFIKNIFNPENWSIKELKNLSHAEVAEEMKNSTFLISLNAFEALNTSVTEAMAAGCVVFCYEGFGPRDFLRRGENAIVFNNNEAYQLAESVFDWIDHFQEREQAYRHIQKEGFATANGYKRNMAQEQLLAFFANYSKK